MAELLGFLSVRQHMEHGYFGGYLILNELARPQEFHCTLPVKPSRAQVLLYGAMLNDFVCGEQIANALVSKAKLKPALIITDCLPVLALGHVSQVETVMLQSDHDRVDASPLSKPDSSMETRELTFGPHRFLAAYDSACKAETLASSLENLAPHFELDEPFQRIVDALIEAHPLAKAA